MSALLDTSQAARSRRAKSKRQISQAALAQRQTALQRANEIRQRRSEVKLALDAATMRFEEVVRSGDDRLDEARVADLLRSIKGVGETRIKRWMIKARIKESTKLVDLNAHQTTLLLLAVGEHEDNNGHWRAARVEAGRAIA